MCEIDELQKNTCLNLCFMIDYSQLMVIVYVSEEKHGTVERKFTVPCFFVR